MSDVSDMNAGEWVKLCLPCEEIKVLINGSYIIETPLLEEFFVREFPLTMDSISIYAEIFTNGIKSGTLKFGLFSPDDKLLVDAPCLFQFADERLPGAVAVHLGKKVSFPEPGCYWIKFSALESSIWHSVRRVELKKMEPNKTFQAPTLSPSQIAEFQDYMNDAAKNFFKKVKNNSDQQG
jgi:hypothetical protein